MDWLISKKKYKEARTYVLLILLLKWLYKRDVKWCRCESGIAIFVWRITFNYVYSPFRMEETSTMITDWAPNNLK